MGFLVTRTTGGAQAAITGDPVTNPLKSLQKNDLNGRVFPTREGGVPWSGVNPEACDLIAAW